MTEKKQNISTPLHPLWLFITITIPHSVILFIFFRIYTLIKSILEQNEKSSWLTFFAILTILLIGYSVYGLFCVLKKKLVHVMTAVSILFFYALFYALYLGSYDMLFPWGRIPRWMVNQFDSYLYLATFLLPCLTYALFVLVRKVKPDILGKGWQNILIAIGIPFLWYFLFFLLMSPLFFMIGSQIITTVLMLGVITGLLLFLFFLIRGIYFIGKNRREFFRKYRLVLLVIFCVVVPFFALLINNGHILGRKEAWWAAFSPFGDFSHPLFYGVVLLNGLILSIPHNLLLKGEGKNIIFLRLLLFLVRSLMFCVTIYFFISLLPFFPFAFLLILIMGLGILLLTPFVLFAFHLQILLEDFKFLAGYFKKRMLFACGIVSFFIIPLIITAFFLIERNNLHKALEYAYESGYLSGQKVKINTNRLKKTLEDIRTQKDESKRGIPYITPYYKQLVLNNLTLSNSKLDYLEKLFTGYGDNEYLTQAHGERERFRNRRIESDILIKHLSRETAYDSKDNLFRSTVHLVLEERSGNFLSEYKTYFKIPRGSWIDDYYLYVQDEKVKGMLAEKKSVLWVYRNIKSERRDPGIIYYARENTAALKVFPFGPREKRRTGFSITHLEPITLTIDGLEIELGGEEEGPREPLEFAEGGGVYLSQAVKSKLEEVSRTPYAHFIVDCSVTSGQNARNGYISQINGFLSKYPGLVKRAKITFANYRFQTLEELTGNEWQEKLHLFKQEGGLALDKVLKSLLYAHYHKGEEQVPVFIVVTDRISRALFDDSMDQFAFTFPDSPYYYHLSNGKIFRHSLLGSKEFMEEVADFVQEPVLAFTHNNRTYYVSDDRGPSIITAIDRPPEAFTGTNLEGAEKYLALVSLREKLILYPGKTGIIWKMLFKESLKINTLTPLTSFAVLENEAQREALRRKQQQILSSKKYLDAGEEEDDAQAMPEPSLVILIIFCFGAFMLWKYLRGKKLKAPRAH